MTDELLFEQSRRGEDAAFRSLYEKYRDPLFRFAWRMTGSVETAEDLTHDCFVSLFRGSFDPKRSALRTFLYASIRNLSRKQWRDAGAEELTDEADLSEAASDGPLDLLISFETADAVRIAVAALPGLQREVIILFEYEDLSLDEIARITGVETGAVKSRLHRARKTLRKTLAPAKVSK
jgi:RNA polymerase sigma-70 factor (ECF subfamily)